jgi:hypothetical protein
MLPNRGGRPRKDNPRNKAVPVRFTTDELAEVTAAAERAGKRPGEWAREKLLKAAKRQK